MTSGSYAEHEEPGYFLVRVRPFGIRCGSDDFASLASGFPLQCTAKAAAEAVVACSLIKQEIGTKPSRGYQHVGSRAIVILTHCQEQMLLRLTCRIWADETREGLDNCPARKMVASQGHESRASAPSNTWVVQTFPRLSSSNLSLYMRNKDFHFYP